MRSFSGALAAMEGRGTVEGRVRVGLFEIDLTSGELYKSGRKIALQQQPFRVLSALIERPGEVVTRENLHSELWPSDTYVAFDEGLNTAIRKLRAAFGDSADNPRFIETVPRRGYRFIAPLSRDNGSAAALDAVEPTLNVPAPTLHLPAQAIESSEGPTSQEARGSRLARGLVAGLVLAAALLLAWEFRPTLPLPSVLRVRQFTRLGNLQRRAYTDGPRIYFSSGAYDERREWHSISVEGGESSPANELKSDWFPQSFSPNGSELLVLRGHDNKAPFWKVSFPSGSMQELDSTAVQGLDVGYGVWSPDGRNIAFVADAGLWVMNSDGSNMRKMATFAGLPSHPAWLPDGSKIRVTVEKWAGNFSILQLEVMEVEVTSGSVRTVPLGVTSPRAVGWLEGGNYFLFRAREAGVSDLWVVRETPGGLRKVDRRPVRLTTGPISFDWPVIGRDGKTIFVVGLQPRAAMQRYNSKTGEFEPFLGQLSGDHLVYSRDGEWFAYIAYPELTLWRCRASGHDCLQLAFMNMHMDGPAWSPDGKTIAFNARADGKYSKGYLVPASGGVPQLLFPDSSTGEEQLSWSSDGKRIMYNEVSASSPPRLRILDLSTRQIADVPDSSGLEGLWSPDGNYIVARDGNKKGKLFDFRTNRWTNLDAMNGDCWWSSNSQYIYFHTLNQIPLDPEHDGIFRLRLSDRHVEKITGVPRFPLIGTWGVGTGRTADDTPLVLEDLTTADLYAVDLDLP
jgi:DNA-binding winged helix-turn-helix (wHTH) protein/Tol biopolymer transport system component